MTALQLQDILRAAQDPWVFLTEFVRTQDPVRGILPFPRYPYLERLVRAHQSSRFLLVPKSRQMMVTWTMVACTLWRAMFRGPGVHLFLSRNERCAEELIARARLILDHLPAFMQPHLNTASREELAMGTLGSRILSLPASPNGPRMYSPTSVFWDEVAFTPYDEYIWSALKPALDSGGTFVGVSSSGGAAGLFAQWVVGSEAPRDSSFIPHPSSLFRIHSIHYSDHPDKKTETWKSEAARGMSQARWDQEQEISFEARSDLVYGEFDAQRHILPAEWTARPEWEIYRAIDFGYRHPFVLWLQRTPGGEIVVFNEWAGEDRTTEDMLAAIRNTDLAHRISEPDVSWSACDPAGAAAQDAGLSPVDVLRSKGIKLRYRASRIIPGIERVKSMLCDVGGRVRLRVSPRCRKLIGDFGRYRWAAGDDEPLKDGVCDHSMDALRYFFVNLESQEELPFASRMAGMRR